MQFWLGMAAGLLIGWLTEWLFGWRRRDPVADDETVALYRELDGARLATSAPAADFVANSPAPDSASMERSDNESDVQGYDDVTKIKGIGPVFAARLSANGFASFAAIAVATPDELRNAAQAAAWQNIDPEGWISQAQALLDAKSA